MRYVHFVILAVCAGIALAAESAFAAGWTFMSTTSFGDNNVVQESISDWTAPAPAPASPNQSVTPVALESHSLNALPSSNHHYGPRNRFGQGRWMFSMDYLYWKATQDATAYAGTLTALSGAVGGLAINSGVSYSSELQNTVYDNNSGLRVNLGYRMGDCWDVGFRYTHFNTDGFASLGDSSVHTGSVLANRLDHNLANTILNVDFDDGRVDFASQRIHLNFDNYDLELRRQLCFRSQRLAVHVMGGIRFSQIDQLSQIRYQYLNSETLLTADTNESVDMSAAGLRAGAEAHYLVGWNTSLFARGAVALMYGDFDITRRDVQTNATAAGVRSVTNNFYNTLPVVDLNVGVRWQRGRFYVVGGYDMSTWFDMPQGIDPIHQDDVDGSANAYRINRGNLSLSGFFAEAGVRF